MPIEIASRRIQYKYCVVGNGSFMYEELVEFKSMISSSYTNRWFVIPKSHLKENGKIIVVIWIVNLYRNCFPFRII